MNNGDKDFDWPAGDIFSRLTRDEIVELNNRLVDKMVADAARVNRVFTKHHHPR
ncbi:hypothetical protein [Mycobacterium malmoense]|uniref:hypothetical protein n=1 Tax=Mycobacterium malmoense TaxID=1780 RepID=UPI0015A62A11|nr:hypothetical protein [Mycobacterium malmoense]